MLTIGWSCLHTAHDYAVPGWAQGVSNLETLHLSCLSVKMLLAWLLCRLSEHTQYINSHPFPRRFSLFRSTLPTSTNIIASNFD